MCKTRWVLMLIVSMAVFVLLSGCGHERDGGEAVSQDSTEATGARETPAEAQVQEGSDDTGADVAPNELDGCLCQVDMDAQTMTVAPLKREEDNKIIGFDASDMRAFTYNADTRIKGGDKENLKVGDVRKGTPITDEKRSLVDLAGHKVSVTWIETPGRPALTEITLVLGFAGESFPAMVGVGGPSKIYWSTECGCGSIPRSSQGQADISERSGAGIDLRDIDVLGTWHSTDGDTKWRLNNDRTFESDRGSRGEWTIDRDILIIKATNQGDNPTTWKLRLNEPGTTLEGTWSDPSGNYGTVTLERR